MTASKEILSELIFADVRNLVESKFGKHLI